MRYIPETESSDLEQNHLVHRFAKFAAFGNDFFTQYILNMVNTICSIIALSLQYNYKELKLIIVTKNTGPSIDISLTKPLQTTPVNIKLVFSFVK